MKTNFLITICLLFAFSSFADAGRYYIPKDKDVIGHINNNNPMERELLQEVEVLVWNVYKGKVVGWENDFNQLAADSDIMILQESFLNPRMKRVFGTNNQFNFVMATAWEDQKYSNTKSGVTTAAKVSPSQVEWQRSYFREPIFNTPKMALFTTYPVASSKTKLLVGNIHGINFVTAGKLKHMIDQAAKIIKKHQGPVILAGDFNTWTQKKINFMNSSLRTVGMKAVTFNPDGRKRVLGKPLDHIWTKGLRVIGSKVLSDITTSDHKPMTMTVEIQN